MTAVLAVNSCDRREATPFSCLRTDEPELVQDFAADANGDVPAIADSGQRWTQTASRRAAVPAVIGGRFTDWDTQAGPSANYLTAQLCSAATHVEAEFEFGASGTTDGENVTLIAASKDFPGGDDGIGWPPDLAMHLVFSPAGWVWSYIADGAGALTPLKTVYYSGYKPGTSRQRAAVTIDRAHGRAWVQAPDGVVTEVSHPTIGSIPSPYVTFEVYYGAADTDKRAMVSSVTADSHGLKG